jgi:hypothetical protein
MLTTANRISRRKEIGSGILIPLGCVIGWTPPTSQCLCLPTRGVSKTESTSAVSVVRSSSTRVWNADDYQVKGVARAPRVGRARRWRSSRWPWRDARRHGSSWARPSGAVGG